MDEEDELLGARDTPETVKRRVIDIMDGILMGNSITTLTEKDVHDVEQAIQKIQNGLNEAKRSILTEDDILNVANLSFLSPSPLIPNATTMFSTPSEVIQNQKSSLDSDVEELDYDESIDGEVNDDDNESERSINLRIVTDEEAENYNELLKNSMEIGEKSTENSQKSAQNGLNGLKIVENQQNVPKIPKIEEEDIIYLSSDTEPDEEQGQKYVIPKRKKITFEIEDQDNQSKADFLKKLTKEQNYLKMRKSTTTIDVSSKLGLTYPLGVTFDTPTDTWFLTNTPYKLDGDGEKGQSKVLKIYVGKDKTVPKYTDIGGPLIENPSAITVYEEGSQVAVLCSTDSKKPSIRLIDLKNHNRIQTFCSWKDQSLDFMYQSRGLARTKGGNLLTTDRPYHGSPRLRIFKNKSGIDADEVTFQLPNTNMPSFIASSNDTVVITDLGEKQVVLLIKLDDSNWKNVKFEIQKIITTTGYNLRAEQMLDTEFFVYVSGAQIDKNGNIIIADAKNHHFKLFKPSMAFVNRISTDFPVPYVSSFHVNQYGECLILSIRETKKIHFTKLTSTNRLEPHVKSSSGKRPGTQNPLSSKRIRMDSE